MEKEQVESEVPASDLERDLAADKTEVASEFSQEVTQILQEARVQLAPESLDIWARLTRSRWPTATRDSQPHTG